MSGAGWLAARIFSETQHNDVPILPRKGFTQAELLLAIHFMSASPTGHRRFPTTLSLAGNMRTRSGKFVGIEVASLFGNADKNVCGQITLRT